MQSTNEPAYEQKVWSYEYAPEEYRAFFSVPDLREGYRVFILWERRPAPKSLTEWVTPDGTWWELWHYTREHRIDDLTTVYMLTEITKSS